MAELLFLGLVIAISPLPVLAFILVLGTQRGVRNGAGYLAGWMTCLVVVVVGTLGLTGGNPPKESSAPSVAGLVILGLLGVAAFAFGIHRWRHPPVPPRPTPKWMERVDRLRPGGAALLAVLIQPWPVVAAGAVYVSRADASKAVTIISLVLFVLFASSSAIAMEVYAVRSPERSKAGLDRLRAWIDRHRDRAVTVLAVVLGVVLVARSTITLVLHS